MSDAQPAPDWWLASDGKWYPPTSAPGWGRSAEPPSRSLGIWLQVALWATAGFGALTVATSLPARDAARSWSDDPSASDLDDWTALNDAATGAVGFVALAVLVVLVLSIVWMNTAHKHEATLQPGGRRFSSGWTIGAWFIPIANWILPKLVLNEIERIAAAARHDDGTVDPAWRQMGLSAVGRLYWLGWVLGSVGTGVATVYWDGEIDTGSLDGLDMSVVLDSYDWRIAGGVALAVAGTFGALHFRRLSRLLNDAA